MIVKIIVVIILIIKVILVIILNLDHAACSVQQVWIHPGVTAYQVQHLHLIFLVNIPDESKTIFFGFGET